VAQVRATPRLSLSLYLSLSLSLSISISLSLSLLADDNFLRQRGGLETSRQNWSAALALQVSGIPPALPSSAAAQTSVHAWDDEIQAIK
jgi:hypothetical protein